MSRVGWDIRHTREPSPFLSRIALGMMALLGVLGLWAWLSNPAVGAPINFIIKPYDIGPIDLFATIFLILAVALGVTYGILALAAMLAKIMGPY